MMTLVPMLFGSKNPRHPPAF